MVFYACGFKPYHAYGDTGNAGDHNYTAYKVNPVTFVFLPGAFYVGIRLPEKINGEKYKHRKKQYGKNKMYNMYDIIVAGGRAKRNAQCKDTSKICSPAVGFIITLVRH